MSFLLRYRVKIVLIISIAIITSLASYYSQPESKFDLNGKYEVVNVIDGDTIEIKINNKVKKVRMLGIDTPETVDPRKTVQCFGKEASDKTKELLIDRRISLELDITQYSYDKYGRILAYVKREDGLFINEYLLENGYAYEYTYNIPYKFQKHFKNLENDAKENKRGLWGLLCLEK